MTDKKLITKFLIDNKVEFQPVNNIYQDYEAYIKVYDISPDAMKNNFFSDSSFNSLKHNTLASNNPIHNSNKYSDVEKHNKSYSSRSKSPMDSYSSKTSHSKPSKKHLERLFKAYDNLIPGSRSRSQINEYESINQSREGILDSYRGNDKSLKKESKNGSKKNTSSTSYKAKSIEAITAQNIKEIGLFLKSNQRALKGEPDTKIQEYIKKLCVENLRGFNLKQHEKIIVLNQVLEAFEEKPFSHLNDISSKANSNSKGALNNYTGSSHYEDESSFKSDQPSSSNKPNSSKDSISAAKNVASKDRCYTEYEVETEEDQNSQAESQPKQNQSTAVKHTPSNIKTEEKYIYEEFESDNKQTPRLGAQEHKTKLSSTSSVNSIKDHKANNNAQNMHKNAIEPQSEVNGSTQNQSQQNTNDLQNRKASMKQGLLKHLKQKNQEEKEAPPANQAAENIQNLHEIPPKSSKNGSLNHLKHKEGNKHHGRNEYEENEGENQNIIAKMRSNAGDNSMNQKMKVNNDLLSHFAKKKDGSDSNRKNATESCDEEGQSFAIKMRNTVGDERMNQKLKLKDDLKNQFEQKSRTSSSSPERNLDVNKKSEKKGSKGSLNKLDKTENGPLKSWTKAIENGQKNPSKQTIINSHNKNDPILLENQAVDSSFERHSKKANVSGSSRNTLDPRIKKNRDSSQDSESSQSQKGSKLQAHFPVQKIDSKNKISNNNTKVAGLNFSSPFNQNEGVQADRSGLFSFREVRNNENTKNNTINSQRNHSPSFSHNQNYKRPATKLNTERSQRTSPSRDRDLSSTESTPAKSALSKAEDLLKRLRMSNQKNIDTQQTSAVDLSVSNDDDDHPYLRGPSYRSPRKHEAMRRLQDSDRMYQQKLKMLNSSFAERSPAVFSTLTQTDTSQSPIHGGTFVFNRDVSQGRIDNIQRQKQTKDWYNDLSRNALKNDINLSDRKRENFMRQKSKDSKAINYEKMSSSDTITFHKMILERTNLQTIENLRKSPVSKNMNDTLLSRR